MSVLKTKGFRNGLMAGVAGAIALSGAGVLLLPGASAQAPRLVAPPPAAVDGSLSFADLVERVAPSVVSVLVEKEVEAPQVPPEMQQFFQYRFGTPDGSSPEDGGQGFDGGGPQHLEAEGSGFFIDAQGHIVTNNHVIEDADEIKVRLSDGSEIAAKLVGADPLTDLAVLKVDPPKGQAYVQFAEDVSLRVGDWVIAVGNPFGLGGSVTSGIVSAIGGQNREGQFLDFVQIDAPINRGNSGGPTFDLKGRVVGVNTAIYSPNGGSVGIGFAIPSKVAKETVTQLISSGSVTRGWLGVSIQPVTTEIAAALGRKETDGALVSEVLEGTPAFKAGVVSGDLILRLNGKTIASPTDLTRSISALPPGEKSKITVLRNGAQKDLTVTLGQRDKETVASNDAAPSKSEDSLSKDVGLRAADITDTMRQQFRIPDGVTGVLVTAVKPGSPAEKAGLNPGVVILQIDGAPVTSTATLKTKIADAQKAGKEAVLLRLQFGEAKQFSALSIKKG
ncbi:MAG: Do family serine endopeptidase [Pseudomonadota bacterium]